MNMNRSRSRAPSHLSIGKAVALATITAITALTADMTVNTHLIVTDAAAVIGRPATPMSYAGVARRTTRRMIYATSVYVATLPANCSTVVVEGVSLHQCGSTYYQPSGGQYVVVQVQ